MRSFFHSIRRSKGWQPCIETFTTLYTIIPVIQTKSIQKSVCMSTNESFINLLLSRINRFAKTRSKGQFFIKCSSISVFESRRRRCRGIGQPSFSKLVTAPQQNQNSAGYQGERFCQQNCGLSSLVSIRQTDLT